MTKFCQYIAISPIAAVLIAFVLAKSVYAAADPATETRKRLLENQRNIYLLRDEQEDYRRQLVVAQSRYDNGDHSKLLTAEIADLKDSIHTADVIIGNVEDIISRQRLVLDALERAIKPSTLDMALNMALNANLSEMAKKLASNEDARRELTRLRTLLKQQAGLGTTNLEISNPVSYAAEQQMAREEYLRLLEALSTDTYKGDDKAPDKLIKIAGTSNNKPFTEKDFLNYVGNSQYHMETTVHKGKMTFTVDGRPWHITVAPEEDKATYVVIYDAAKANHPRLVMFNKALLTE